MSDTTLTHESVIARVRSHRVDDPVSFRLSDCDPDSTGDFSDEDKAVASAALKVERGRIRQLQERLYAEHGQSLLIVLQATDTGGKDSTIRRVFKGVNPQGVRVWSFKEPSKEELDHDFLWRYHDHTPGKGMIAIFNRSHYEDVLIVRVKGLVPESVWSRRFGHINDFERLLTDNRTRVLKFFLNISREEQRKRLQDRLDESDKHWKFDSSDLAERARWDDYQVAFEDAIRKTSTEIAPWYVVPANHKWYRDLVVARAIVETLEAMDPQFPPPEPGLDRIVIPE
ncbi:MAG TPA: polyphosphate kinase 2 family protein [Thermomicrobiales bacterium]|nr:polyphosphate kinase 2 family protein [Thermomicrobiales bacterium]